MKTKKVTVGKVIPGFKSDCNISLTSHPNVKCKINVESKVRSMYGKSIEILIKDMLKFFKLNGLKIDIVDSGALPFTLAARFEAAVKRFYPNIDTEYLLEFNSANNYASSKNHLRRTRLYLPGNEPKYFTNAGLHKPDGIILDLEDSVSPLEKDAARILVRNALRSVDFYGSERMVRINQLPLGLTDLEYIVPHNVNVILIPKCESKNDILQVEEYTLKIKKKFNINNDIYFMPIIESAKGVINAYEIAAASIYNCALAIGLEDYTADIGTSRTEDGAESFYARSVVVNSAKAAGIQAIDTVYSDVANEEGLIKSVQEAVKLGFEGKGCIHPRQINIVNKYFAPTELEIEKAKIIIVAYKKAKKQGTGVVSIGTKMIDAPVVKRAERVIELAIVNKLISKNWFRKYEVS